MNRRRRQTGPPQSAGELKRADVRRRVTVGLLVFALLATAGATLAAGPPTIARYVMAGGGDQVSAGNFTIRSTIGQAATGRATANDTELCSGYWCAPFRYDVFLPLVIRT